MVVTEIITFNNKQYTKNYSNCGYYIMRDNVKYSEAIDLLESGRVYTESSELIEEEATEQDYIEALENMGVSFND